MEESSKSSVKIVGFWASLFVHRVRWALKLKGVDYEYIEEDIFNKTPLLSEVNPVYGKVPVLIHDGKNLPESAIIIEYIDETWNDDDNNTLMPQDPYERAQARFWAKFVDEKLLYSTVLALGSEGEKQGRAVEVAIEHLEKLEEVLNGKDFFGGNKIGYLDLIIGVMSYMLPVWEEVSQVKIFDPLKFPGMAAWKINFLNHPAIKAAAAEYLPSKSQMITFFEQRRKELIPVFASHSI